MFMAGAPEESAPELGDDFDELVAVVLHLDHHADVVDQAREESLVGETELHGVGQVLARGGHGDRVVQRSRAPRSGA
jgi:hypothetical protein